MQGCVCVCPRLKTGALDCRLERVLYARVCFVCALDCRLLRVLYARVCVCVLLTVFKCVCSCGDRYL